MKLPSIPNFWSFAVVILVLLLISCTSTVTQNVHLRYGNPSRANDNYNNYLIAKPEYALSYNCQTGIANWVRNRAETSFSFSTKK